VQSFAVAMETKMSRELSIFGLNEQKLNFLVNQNSLENETKKEEKKLKKKINGRETYGIESILYDSLHTH